MADILFANASGLVESATFLLNVRALGSSKRPDSGIAADAKMVLELSTIGTTLRISAGRP